MDIWLGGADRSDLYSDEGTLFGQSGLGEWQAAVAEDLRRWLVREN